LVNVGTLFIADSQAAKLVQPGEGSFYYPPPLAESTAMCGVSLGEPSANVSGTKAFTDCLRVITTVAHDTIRTIARTSSLSL